MRTTIENCVPESRAELPRFRPSRRSSILRRPLSAWGSFLPPQTLGEVAFESVSEVEDEPDVAFEAFLTSIFSSWTLILLFPPRRRVLSFQRSQSMTTGITIVRKIVTPITIHSFVDPGMPYGSGSGPGRAVSQEWVGKDTKQGAVVVCMEQVL